MSNHNDSILIVMAQREWWTSAKGSNTPVEVDYYRNGGILPAVLRGLLK